jgi:Domain of Unknown Function (DUF349)
MFLRSAPHEHAEPAQRILGAAQLAPDSKELARLLAADPVPEVRAAAAQRCNDLTALGAAWQTETDSAVRAALASALGNALAETQDSAGARALLEADHCADAIRAAVAHRTQDTERRRIAIRGMRDESPLVELALGAGHAETRLAAAERVSTPDGLRTLADAARSRDHGVARLARQRLDALENRRGQTADADTICAQLETLASKPGPILTAVVDLDRRWQALEMSDDTARLTRHAAARQLVQARFDREHDEQRAQARFARRLREYTAKLGASAAPEALSDLRTELAALRDEARARGDAPALAELEQAEQRLAQWDEEHQALAGAEALVIEAEQLAAGTYVDNAKLPERWQALDAMHRTPALTLRFETALMVVEQRRLALSHEAQQKTHAVRQLIHGLLHTAEQAIAAGQMQLARAGVDKIRTLKADAGLLPKPTNQRLGRLVQQLVELERWESFGQRNARLQLCERAEAIPVSTLDAPQLALEVQKLRNEWKALDTQHAGVPKALWQRFDGACEKAYAPAAQHFAELAAQRKQARRQRDEFIALAAAHAPTLLDGPRDWRAVERWLRETEQAWREGNLGSVEPRAWKKFDVQFKAALAPLRDALAAARDQAKADRLALIGQATALVAKAMERDTLTQIKALQAAWQEQAKALSLLQRDERPLWEQFRAACDAVFAARQNKRKAEDNLKQQGRRALEDICTQLEQLALATDRDDQEIRKTARELAEQWRKHSGESDPALRGIESRVKKAKTAVDAMLSARARSRAAAVWTSLAAKERLCEELDGLVRSGNGTCDPGQLSAVQEKWAALPPLPGAWENKMLARRDAALRALAETSATSDYVARIERGAGARRESLLEFELMLGLDSPAELQAQRLALQVKQLRERFNSAASASTGTAGERLLAWCAEPGVIDTADRQRCERVIAKVALAN